ncbi:MAG TPA: multicopper oxidase domain-containing protein [Burkholderiaceae bacterium]|jgi:FtsP/CotA-like multicopper oxidase with cupredoxin domain|nr:multicopper oxidase domain-containing protein [Burkholderiaceae bacterium]
MSRATRALASLLLAASASAGAAGSAVSAAASAPAAAPAFDPRSTDAAPCGTGTPPPGHAMPELRPPPGGATLVVRQDGARLCYVADGVADAPVIRARPGAELALTLRNEIADPSRIEAAMAPGKLRIANEPVPAGAGFYQVVPGMHHAATGATNLHVHGFAVPPVAPQDDVLTVCTDPAVGPAACGRREFTYRYRIPAGMPEGLYWYHPHMHGEVQAQMLMGLTGAIVIEGPEHDARRAAGVVERVLVVRQTQDQDAGKTPAQSMTAALPAPARAPGAHAAPGNAIDTAHELLCTSNSGIDQISLNGTPVPVGDAPDEALAHLEIDAGTRQFWQLLNAATDAFLSLSLEDEQGRALPLQVVARDGSPLTDDAGRRLQPPPSTDAQSVPPGGRLEFWVAAPPPGVKATLVTHAIDTGCAGDRLPERRLAVVVARGGADASATPAPARAADVHDAFTGLLARKVDRRRVIALAEYPRPGTDDQTDFYIVERKPGAVLRPYRMGDAPTITVQAGTTEEWVIENWTNELHTFHIHQLHFRVLEVDGRAVAAPPLLDVVEVPYATATGFRSKEGPVRPGRVRIRMTFPAALAGDIPFHCHLVDHEDNGMMAVLRIAKPGAAPRPGHPAPMGAMAHMQQMEPTASHP